MNKCIFIGRLTADPDVRYGDEGKCMCSFRIAVGRKYKNAEGNYDADFASCKSFGKTAEFIGKHFTKGSMISVCGSYQTGSYTNKEGTKVYTNDFIIDEAEFAESKKKEDSDVPDGFTRVNEGFM